MPMISMPPTGNDDQLRMFCTRRRKQTEMIHSATRDRSIYQEISCSAL